MVALPTKANHQLQKCSLTSGAKVAGVGILKFVSALIARAKFQKKKRKTRKRKIERKETREMYKG